MRRGGAEARSDPARRRAAPTAAATIARLVLPMWDLGARALVGWRPSATGLDVLLVPCWRMPELGAALPRLVSGRRLMGPRTFAEAVRVTGARPVPLALTFRVSDADAGAVPVALVERALRRFAITMTAHRGVALFDIVGFSKQTPLEQIVQITSLDQSISGAQRSLQQMGVKIALARSTTGDGFYLWNREKGANADLATYLLMLFVLADNAIAHRLAGDPGQPALRACFSVGSHFSHWQVDRLRPGPHRSIVGDITITLARLCAQALPGQILVGEFRRPADAADRMVDTREFVSHAATVLEGIRGRRLRQARVEALTCYLTGGRASEGAFHTDRLLVIDKHGFTHAAYNQKLNLTVRSEPRDGGLDMSILLGRPHREVAGMAAASDRSG